MLVSDDLLIAATEPTSTVEDAGMTPGDWTQLRRYQASPYGGVLLELRPGVTIKRRRELESELGENFWTSVTYCGSAFIVCVIYIKPKSSDAVYRSALFNAESDCSGPHEKY